MSETTEERLLERIRELESELAELRPPAPALSSTELLLCAVGAHRVAFPLGDVEEAARLARTSSVPDAPTWVLGLLNLRGAMVPVVDVRSRIERQPRRPGLDERILICAGAKGRFGLLVTEIIGQFRADPAPIEVPGGQRASYAFVSGLVNEGDRPILIARAEALAQDAGLDALLQEQA